MKPSGGATCPAHHIRLDFTTRTILGPLPIETAAGWAPESVWAFWRRETSLVLEKRNISSLLPRFETWQYQGKEYHAKGRRKENKTQKFMYKRQN